jgi:hypothetical protein
VTRAHVSACDSTTRPAGARLAAGGRHLYIATKTTYYLSTCGGGGGGGGGRERRILCNYNYFFSSGTRVRVRARTHDELSEWRRPPSPHLF